MKRNKAKRKLQLQAEEATERDASAYGRATLKRLADAVTRPVSRDPRP